MLNMTILAGRDKTGSPETFMPITMHRGELWTIVGNTGSGKSRLIKDVEQLADGDSVTRRRIMIDGISVSGQQRRQLSTNLVAHLGQNMRFVLDTTVEEFIKLHAICRNKNIAAEAVLELVNRITPEPVSLMQNLNLLSGGQSRALMIADVALICDSPIVLVDEIENAGVDKEEALRQLQSRDKLVLVVTHDSHTALMAQKRIVMGNGGITTVVERSAGETAVYEELSEAYCRHRLFQSLLRKGEHLT